MEFEGNIEWFNVFVDNNYIKLLKTDSLPQCYRLASGLPDTLHHLLITKRYETSNRPIVFTGMLIDSGKQLKPLPPPAPYLIELIGSSTMIGYGNEAKTMKCDSIELLSNCDFSFGPLTAEMLGAEYTILAITRKGMVRNYRSPFIASLNPFPVYYDRILRNDPSGVIDNRNVRPPDVIVIMLGTNDFSTRPYPTKELFRNRYYAFVKELEKRYPGVKIICLTSPREPLRTYLYEFVKRGKEEGNENIFFP